MNIANWIFGGCSFTADGISGGPPNYSDAGNSSFLDYPSDGITAVVPKTWAGMVAQELGIISSTVNVAASSHGNILSARAILYLLKHYNYNSENTFILFNITDPGRYDILCDFNDDERSIYIPWTEKIIPFIPFNSKHTKRTEFFKNQNLREIDRYTSDVLYLFINYLKQKNFKFLFTSMRDYSKHTDLSAIINENLNYFVPCGDQIGMMEYCIANNITVSDKDFHPSYEGHKKISNIVTRFLKENQYG